MKKQVEPIILIVALVILALVAGLLAYLYPTVKDITGIAPLTAQGKNVVPLKADDVAASLVAWTSPTIWSEPASGTRLFNSDIYLFYPNVYLQDPNNGAYVARLDKNTRLPSGMLVSWADAHGLDITDGNIDHEDPDGDGFSNLTEFKNEPVGVRLDAKDVDGTKSTDPNDAKSHPDYLSRLRLQKIETQPFHILFFGYNQINGKMRFQLQLADVPSYNQPPLKASGDELGFGGYVIGEFHEEFKDVLDPPTHQMVHTNVSTLELDQPETGQKVTLPFRKAINSPDVTANFVMLMPTERDKVIRISVGKTFSVPFVKGKSFLVVSADEKGAVIKDTASSTTYPVLQLEEKEWDEVPQAPAEKQP